jgi:hypothetical protein
MLATRKRAARHDLGKAGKTQRVNLGSMPVLKANGTTVAGLEKAIKQENREHPNNCSDDNKCIYVHGT